MMLPSLSFSEPEKAASMHHYPTVLLPAPLRGSTLCFSELMLITMICAAQPHRSYN